MTVPSVWRREPWQGQSQFGSPLFHSTRHPIYVQTAEAACLRSLATTVPASFMSRTGFERDRIGWVTPFEPSPVSEGVLLVVFGGRDVAEALV